MLRCGTLRSSILARALALLAVVLGLGEGALAHHGETLHELQLQAQLELASACSRQHPASFEAAVGRRASSCVACIAQVQQSSTSDAPLRLSIALPAVDARWHAVASPLLETAGRPAASRGPPRA